MPVEKPVQLPSHQPGVVITVPLQWLIEYLEINDLDVIEVKPTLVLIVKTNSANQKEERQ